MPEIAQALGIEKDSELIPQVPKFERKGPGGTYQSQTIFHAIDSGVPVKPFESNGGLSEAVKAKVRDYEKAKAFLDRKRDRGEWVSYLDMSLVYGDALAQLVAAVLEEAAQEDKAGYEKSLANTGKNKTVSKRRDVEVRGTKVTIPSGFSFTYVQKGYCMDPSIPAPGKDDAYEIWHVSDRVPAQLVPLYQAVGRWAARPENKSSAQSLTWAIMGAGTESGWAKNISKESLAKMEQAMPGGAQLFVNYHNSQIMVANVAKAILKKTKLDRYIDPDFTRGTANTIANSQLDELIRQGQLMQGGKGVGYSMLAENVAARATGDATLTPKIEVANASGKDFELEILDWFAQPIAKKQGASTTGDVLKSGRRPFDVQNQAEEDKNPTREKFLTDLTKDTAKFLLEHKFDEWGLKGPAGVNALSKALSNLGRKYGIPRNYRKPLITAAGNILSMTPFVGNALSAYEFVTGKDWLTGENLSAAERALALAGTVPGASALRAASRGWNGALAGNMASYANKNFFKNVDRSDIVQKTGDFIFSDTVNNVFQSVDGNDPGWMTQALKFNAETKDFVGDFLTMDGLQGFWQPWADSAFKASGKAMDAGLNAVAPRR